MKHLVLRILLTSLTLLAACGGSNESESTESSWPDSSWGLIGDVLMSWTYTQNGVEKHEELQFNYTQNDVVANQNLLIKKINSKYTLACSVPEYVVGGGPNYICELSPSNRSDGLFDFDSIQLWKTEQTDSSAIFQGSISTEGDLSLPISLRVTRPQS